jgi:hypothetical protein
MSGEHLWIVSSTLSNLTPNFVFHTPDIDFCIENSLKSLTLRIIINASQFKSGHDPFSGLSPPGFYGPFPSTETN